jgi:tetratricopeptide (TPR) repeat protein
LLLWRKLQELHYNCVSHIHSFKQKGDLAKASAILDQRFKFNPRRHHEQEESLLIQLEHNPDSLKFTTKLARNYFIRGIFRTAESLLRRAVQISGNNSLVLSNLGYFLLQTGGEMEADAILNLAVRQDEHCATAWTNLGELEYMRQTRAGRAKRSSSPRPPMEKAARKRCVAENHHRRAIQEDPRLVAVLQCLGADRARRPGMAGRGDIKCRHQG